MLSNMKKTDEPTSTKKAKLCVAIPETRVLPSILSDASDDQTWEFIVLVDNLNVSDSTAVDTRSTTPELDPEMPTPSGQISEPASSTVKRLPSPVTTPKFQKSCLHCDQGSFLEFCFKEDACACVCHNTCSCKPCQKIRETRPDNESKLSPTGSQGISIHYRSPSPFKYPNPFRKCFANKSLAPKVSKHSHNASNCSVHSFEGKRKHDTLNRSEIPLTLQAN